MREDGNELEYFDVLNLLPLSKVRLEYNESDARSTSSLNHNNNNSEKNRGSNFGNVGSSNNGSLVDRRRDFIDQGIHEGVTSSEVDDDYDDDDDDDDDECENELAGDIEWKESRRELEISKIPREKIDPPNFGKNYTDEEKCKSQPSQSCLEIVEFHERREERDSWQSFARYSPVRVTDRRVILPSETLGRSEGSDWLEENVNIGEAEESASKDESASSEETESGTSSLKDVLEEGLIKEAIDDVSLGRRKLGEIATKNRVQVEEAEDYKSIWISDSEEPEEMSRRPQVLKVVDNEVTKRRGKASSVDEIDVVTRETPMGKHSHRLRIANNLRADSRQRTNSSNVREDGSILDSDKDVMVRAIFVL